MNAKMTEREREVSRQTRAKLALYHLILLGQELSGASLRMLDCAEALDEATVEALIAMPRKLSDGMCALRHKLAEEALRSSETGGAPWVKGVREAEELIATLTRRSEKIEQA